MRWTFCFDFEFYLFDDELEDDEEDVERRRRSFFRRWCDECDRECFSLWCLSRLDDDDLKHTKIDSSIDCRSASYLDRERFRCEVFFFLCERDGDRVEDLNERGRIFLRNDRSDELFTCSANVFVFDELFSSMHPPFCRCSSVKLLDVLSLKCSTDERKSPRMNISTNLPLAQHSLFPSLLLEEGSSLVEAKEPRPWLFESAQIAISSVHRHVFPESNWRFFLIHRAISENHRRSSQLSNERRENFTGRCRYKRRMANIIWWTWSGWAPNIKYQMGFFGRGIWTEEHVDRIESNRRETNLKNTCSEIDACTGDGFGCVSQKNIGS